MAFYGEDDPTRSPLNQRIVILYNQMLKKYGGETHALWPRPLSGGVPLSSFLHSQRGEREGKMKKEKKTKKPTNLLSHTFQVVDNPIHEKTEENI